MQSRSSSLPADGTVTLKAGLLLLSVSLNALEFFIPRIPLLPWLKPGLANLVTIAWIIRFGAVDALLFSVLRVWITGFYFGFSILTLVLGLTGSVVAVAAMGAIWRLLGTRRLVGIVGMGMVGAFAHNAGQLGAVYLLFARNPLVLYQAPVMALASTVLGAIVGLLAASLVRTPAPATAAFPSRLTPPAPTASSGQATSSLLLLGWSAAVMFVQQPRVLLWHALAATVLVQAVSRGSLRALLAPARSFWMLLVMVAAVHLFFSYGRSLPGVPFITHEGAAEAARQLLRLWTWLQLSQVLRRWGFGAWIMATMARVIPRRRDTLTAGVLALEFFPDTLAWARKAVGPAALNLLRQPRTAARGFASGLHQDLLDELSKSLETDSPERQSG